MATVVHSVTSWEIGQTSLKFGSFVVPCLGVYVVCNNNTWNSSDSGILRLTSAQAQAIGAAFRASNILSACGLSCNPRALWGGTFTTETITGNNGLSVVFSSVNTGSATVIIRYALKQGSSNIVYHSSYAAMDTQGKLAYTVSPVFIDKATNRVIAGSSISDFNIYTYPVSTPENTNVCDNKIPCVVGGTLSIGISSGVYLGSQDYITGGKLLGEEIDPTPIPPDTDPYSPGGNTGDDTTDGEGGTGDFDNTSDPIDFPDLPTVSAVDTRFVTIFNPSSAQLISLADYMWSPLFDVDTLKKLWANPMDCILGLTMVPFSVPDGGTGTVAIGNVSTGISMTKAGSQYVAIDCGSINVKEFWGGYLDYDPYTKFQIYLPYVGIKPLLADEIMGKSIHVKYHCDILTGACNCFVKCGGSVLYSFNGQCSTQIPISGNDWRNTISAAINIAGQAAGMYITGGATAPMGITSIAQSAVNGLKQTVEKSGSLSGTGGMLAIQKPYLIATRPKQAVPQNQNRFTGYPAFITRKLSSCEGYTEVYSCHLENIPCTSDELNEIENLLKSGVIL